MLYEDFKGEKVSRLGFGAMRLPLLENGSIDEVQVQQMVDVCMSSGVNYFDTAYPYHGGLSEIVLAKCLKKYSRDSYYLATKYPGHQIAETYNPADVFEEQLQKCDVDYFDFYLLHNVYENSLPVYLDERWGIIDYFVKQRDAGRIKHLGFSTHGGIKCLEDFLKAAGDKMEFCQIQMNYLDWTLQSARRKTRILSKLGLGIWVMEPVRGGMLCNLDERSAKLLKDANADRSLAEWAMAWQLDKSSKVVLSGSSSLDQLQENIAVFERGEALTSEEQELLERIVDSMKDSIPCTSCRYCCSSCPKGLDIPYLMSIANEIRVKPSFDNGMRIDALEAGKRPNDCIACKECEMMCPQAIEIPKIMAEITEAMKEFPHWEDLCEQRAEAARKLREAAR